MTKKSKELVNVQYIDLLGLKINFHGTIIGITYNKLYKIFINIVTKLKKFHYEILKEDINNSKTINIIVKNLKNSNGHYDLEKDEIYIHNNIEIEDLELTLFHELIHQSTANRISTLNSR